MRYDNLGLLALAQGEPAGALAQHDRALAIWQRAHGEQHDHVAEALTDVAAAQVALGQRAQARASLERAEAIWRGLAVYDTAAAGSTRLALSELIDGDPVRARQLARMAIDASTDAGVARTADAEHARPRLTALGG